MSLTESASGLATITPQELYKRHQRGEPVELIDVRTPAEYHGLHASIARSAPLDALDPKSFDATRTGPAGTPVYVICRSGARSEKACAKLQGAGRTQVVNVVGGTMAWEQAGLPVVKGRRQVLPLDRQVQTTAGALNLSGVLLGWFVDPNWFLLSGFIGCGLIMAGLTGYCPMARLIALMPWNQAGSGSSSSCCAP